jgi:hypothetical protein
MLTRDRFQHLDGDAHMAGSSAKPNHQAPRSISLVDRQKLALNGQLALGHWARCLR